MKFDFGNANAKQKEAIVTTEGPLLIIAGPGTGKTFTLVKRIAYLIVEKKVYPKNIMAVTFTEKAAKELISRITDELIKYNTQIDVNEMYVGTFHQICLKIIKEFREEAGIGKNYNMLDDFETKYFIYRNLKEFDEDDVENLFDDEKDTHKNWSKADKVLYVCSKIIEEIEEPDELLMDSDEDIESVGQIVKTYRELLSKENTLDFSSILFYCYNLLKSNEDIRKIIEDRIKYIIVDEYQDTNKIQEKILFKILNKDHNICVVGDDDQGLYRFRGATITNLLQFPTNFKEGECKEIFLVNNYRSNQKIVDFYNNFMDNPVDFEWGQSRFNKKIVAAKSGNDTRVTVLKCSDSDEDKWHAKVFDFIKTLQGKEIISDLNQIAFLAYSISSPKIGDLINYLEDKGVPCYAPRSKQFFERSETKLLIGSLILCFSYIANNLGTGVLFLNKEFQDYYISCGQAVKDLFKSNPTKYAPLINYIVEKNRFFSTFNEKSNLSFGDIVYELFQFSPFTDFLDTKNLKNVHDERPIRNLSLFTQIISRYERIYKLNFLDKKSLERRLSTLFCTYLWFIFDEGLGEFEDEKDVSPSGCITFLTIHQSKGLEFPIVFIDSLGTPARKNYNELIEKIKSKYTTSVKIEKDEYIRFYDYWRLFYTGFSRAESLLVLTCVETSRTPIKYITPFYCNLPDCNTVDLSGLQVEKIKMSKVKDTYSFTSCIEIYNRCAKQYEFFHEYEFAEVKKGSKLYGSIVHETIEDIHKAFMNGKGDIVNEAQIGAWMEINYNTLSKNLFSYLTESQRNAALKEVLNYYKYRKGDFSNIKDAEVDVSLIRDKYIMKGTVDLIAGDGDTVEIIDFKSMKKPDMIKDKDLIDTYRKQVEVYAWLVEQYHNVKVSKMHLYFTAQDSGKPTLSFDKDDKSISQTIKEFDETVEKIQNKDFSKRCSELRTCSTCNMHPHCNLRK